MVREAIYEWMIRWLRGGEGEAKEEQVELVPDYELLVTERGQIDGTDLYRIIERTPRQKGTTEELKTFVSNLVEVNPPLATNFKILPEAPAGSKRPAVVLIQNNLETGPEAKELLGKGNVVVLVAPSGATRGNTRARIGNWLNNTRAWLIGRNLPAMHAAEINTAVRAAAGRSDVDPAGISARASGVDGVWLLLAAATNPQITNVSLDHTPHSLAAALQSPVHTNLHDAVIPGFALKWDLGDLRQLIAPRAVTWTDPTDWMGNVVKLDGPYEYTSSDPSAQN
jgi:hypothetical protein